MNLSYEYNEYVIGYVITDEEADRTLNFQFEKFHSCNHPEPKYYLYSACEGDETYRDWSEEERAEARDWLRSHDDVKEIESAFTKAMYENEEFSGYTAPLQSWQILEAAEEIDNE